MKNNLKQKKNAFNDLWGQISFLTNWRYVLIKSFDKINFKKNVTLKHKTTLIDL